MSLLAIATDSYHIYLYQMNENLKFEEIKREDESHMCITTNSRIISLEWFED